MKNDFCLQKVDLHHAADVKADVRMQMFFVLRNALQSRKADCSFTDKELADAIGKDPAYVSRMISGKSAGITAETLAVFLAALNCHVRITAEKREHISISNRQPPTATIVEKHSGRVVGWHVTHQNEANNLLNQSRNTKPSVKPVLEPIL